MKAGTEDVPAFNIQEELKKLPHRPGVYIMRDRDDAILYVGKAVDLNNRVHSYFRKNIGRGPQIDMMVSRIGRFEVIVTDSELEALVLENNLIKEHRPRYNTLLKDDKTYPYIKVTLRENYPRILLARQVKKDGAKYFGPFTGAQAVRDTIDLINKLFGLRTCAHAVPFDNDRADEKKRACLNYHMKQCSAPCINAISKEAYAARVEKALSFLNGDVGELLDDLKARMLKASEDLEFEEAARLRDLSENIVSVTERQKMSDSRGIDRDIVALAKEEKDAVVQVFFVRDGRLIGREHYTLTQLESDDDAGLLSDFVKQFYSGTPFLPKEVLLPVAIDDEDIISRWLSDKKGGKVRLIVPERGQNSKLLKLAEENASLILKKDRERLRREEGRTIGAVKEIRDILGLEKLDRMEAFDISNTSGFANVGSMVVFEKGKPKRSDYRKFRIRSVSGPDDYACMREVLSRRLKHGLEEAQELELREIDEKYGSFSRMPDLILMDGGRGQVNIALEVLEELDIDIPVAGMVKDDHHNTRGLYFNNKELPIDKDSEGFKLITRMQDEAHRFAIEYHRSIRSKTQVKSVLDDIPGIGEKRRKALMMHFASIEEIKEADVSQLMEVPGIRKHEAEAIVGFFRKS